MVNAYFDDLRRDGGRPYSVPQAIGPPYLAGAFSPVLCDVRLYNEQYSGPLEDKDLLGWPDMLVLTGLTVAFDRMRQLTGYARTLNPKVIVVAGGPAVRALPRYSGRFFDYACTGDIEQMQDVIADAVGPAYVNRDMFPRFDLTYWFGRIAYVESSRNCNFRCSFCSLTGEGNRYQKYDLDYIRRQVMAVGKRRQVYFLDNNFYGNDRGFFLDRLELLKEMKREGRFGGWGALVTQDFFLNDENLRLARESGCIGLFSGIESFDVEVLRRFNKRQNARVPQVELIRKCLDAGILFLYGVIFDLSSRRLSECREEIAFITGTPEIPLPSFVTQAIPLLGTPYFHECLEKGLLLPNTKLRDMDGTTLVQRPLDPIDEVRSLPEWPAGIAGLPPPRPAPHGGVSAALRPAPERRSDQGRARHRRHDHRAVAGQRPHPHGAEPAAPAGPYLRHHHGTPGWLLPAGLPGGVPLRRSLPADHGHRRRRLPGRGPGRRPARRAHPGQDRHQRDLEHIPSCVNRF
ncbi:MAG: radical SAM protein [Proteobacteria bacterium]|nr:radical SAM protein [Pseudomonadota bacterium]